MSEELLEGEFYTLTDDDGNENQFELIASCELDGNVYLALVPVAEDGTPIDEEEYVILKRETDDEGEEILVTIDDDDEFERIADIFSDEFADIDYDAGVEDDEEEAAD